MNGANEALLFFKWERYDAHGCLCVTGGLVGQEAVDFRVNASFEEVQSLLGDAVGGLHTMLDEHFGISIVEYMAAGKLAAISHRLLGMAMQREMTALNVIAVL